MLPWSECAYGGQVIDGVLAQISLSVGLMAPGTHPVGVTAQLHIWDVGVWQLEDLMLIP